jgi:hypothetical protein
VDDGRLGIGRSVREWILSRHGAPGDGILDKELPLDRGEVLRDLIRAVDKQDYPAAAKLAGMLSPREGVQVRRLPGGGGVVLTVPQGRGEWEVVDVLVMG